MRRYVRGQLGSYGAVDDTVQDTLLAITTAVGEGKQAGRPALAFAVDVAHAIVDDTWRRIGADPEEPIHELPDIVDPGPGPDRSIESTQLWEALATLPAQHREVLMLRVALGYSASETAAIMGIPAGSVRVAQHRALARMRTLLGW